MKNFPLSPEKLMFVAIEKNIHENNTFIENKINGAEDQQEQLERYIKEMKKRIENPYAIYLTWDGSKKVSDNSLSKQEQHRMHETVHLIELNYVFEKNSSLEKLIKALSAISLETIFKEESLIVFDNVNASLISSSLGVLLHLYSFTSVNMF